MWNSKHDLSFGSIKKYIHLQKGREKVPTKQGQNKGHGVTSPVSLSSIVEVFFLQLSPLYYIHLDYSLSRSSATTFFMPKSGAPAKNDPIFVLSPCSLQSLRTALAKYNNVLSSGSAKNFALLFLQNTVEPCL